MNKKGSILMITLWILTILVIFSLGLGHRAAINLRLVRYQRDRLKAACLARAGINRAVAELENDKNSYDSLTKAWADNEKAFSKIMLSNNENEFATVSYLDEKGETKFGIIDEERKINLNGTTDFDKNKILTLLSTNQIEDAADLRNTIIDWISPGSKIEIAKKGLLTTPEELLPILEYFYEQKVGVEECQKKAQEVFNKIKDLITVYGEGKININTASPDLLTILANSVADNNEKGVVSGFITEITKLRENQPNKAFEAMDGIIGIPDEYTNLLSNFKSNLIVKSNHFRIESQGKVGNVTKNITAVYNRDKKKFVYWHEN